MSIEVVRMAGLATIQDAGRPRHRAQGVPLCGAMDVASLALANSLVGNPPHAAAIEWALASGSLRFAHSAVIAAAGARAELRRGREPFATNVAVQVRAGDELTVERFTAGAYLYLAVRGGIAVPNVLGSRSTYLPAAFGGLDGRRLRAGDRIPIALESESPVLTTAGGPTSRTLDDCSDREIRVIEGPNGSAFSPDFRDAFFESDFTISTTSNRAGYRLERGSVSGAVETSGVSEPACVGAIQVPRASAAIVLMADGPTVGGYPKIGVVASVDISALAQRTPGSTVRFKRITVEEAQRLLRDRRAGRPNPPQVLFQA